MGACVPCVCRAWFPPMHCCWLWHPVRPVMSADAFAIQGRMHHCTMGAACSAAPHLGFCAIVASPVCRPAGKVRLCACTPLSQPDWQCVNVSAGRLRAGVLQTQVSSTAWCGLECCAG